jgi:hypothetical protein
VKPTKRMNVITLAAMLFSAFPVASANTPVSPGILDCAVLKASIESKLKANNVPGYSLDIVAANWNASGKVSKIVGSCNNGRQRIVYVRLEKPAASGESSLPQPSGDAPAGSVDVRGFIDVWALRKDVVSLSSTPLRQVECKSAERDDDQEYLAGPKTKKARVSYERKRRDKVAKAREAMARCEHDNLWHSEKLKQLHAAFNASWQPVLKSAMQRGDPVAEVVLRLCETTSLLDRRDIASTCSEKAEDKEYARQRLKQIDFKPALNYPPTKQELAGQETCPQMDASGRTECAMRDDIARYERIVSVMRYGYLSVAESWNTCQDGDQNPDKDKLAEECQRRMNLMMALSAGVNRFYTVGPIHNGVEGLRQLSLQRPILKGEAGAPVKAWPYDKRGVVTRNDWRPFSDANFQKKFYAELDQAMQQIEMNIADDLRKEPRWAVFLIERIGYKLYDAMNTENSGKPTSAEIETLEANSPRAQAIRKEQEIERFKTASYRDLIESLHTSRNLELHYSWDRFPLNLQELKRRPSDIAALVAAYYAEKNDDVFRFNIIMILNNKSRDGFSPEEASLIAQCFVDALSDSSSLVRAEASWQDYMLGDHIYNPAVQQLLRQGRQEEQEALRKWMGR